MFKDRQDAGRQLGERLLPYAREDAIVLGLPRGGIPVAAEIARKLQAPLDVLVVRKLGAPGHEELAFGAIGPAGGITLNPDVVQLLGLCQSDIERVAAVERRELERREHRFRGRRPFPNLAGRTVILVDDGLATGATAMAAIGAVRHMQPRRIILAVPVGSAQAVSMLRPEVDELLCLVAPDDFRAVSLWYEHFNQTSDEEVIRLLGTFQEQPERQTEGREG